jgi:hypothetical protein
MASERRQEVAKESVPLNVKRAFPFPMQTANGLVQCAADQLTVAVAGVACDC